VEKPKLKCKRDRMRIRETQCREEEKSIAEKKNVEKSTNLLTIGFF
jgi:hypothetical protein